MTDEETALAALKEECRNFASGDGDSASLARLSEALDRYWVAGSSHMEPIDPDDATRRAVAEAIDWDRAFG